MRFTTAAFTLGAFASSALAHMEMSQPPPFRSSFNKAIKEDTVDFDNNAPLKPDGSDFPCKGYATDFGQSPAGDPTATWPAGSTQQVVLADSGDPEDHHDGGSCQLSLSFDGGKSFKVIKSIEGGCVNPSQDGPQGFDFTVPKDAKNGNAIFAWSWFNHTGNREMYMNCAAVTITNGADSTLTDHPDLFKAHIGNQCQINEGDDVQFPNPGNDLQVISKANLHPPKGSDCGSSTSTSPGNPNPSTSSGNPSPSDGSNNPDGSDNSGGPGDGSGDGSDDGSDDSAKPKDTSTTNVSYTVVSGDICATIAKANGITLKDLYKQNPDINKGCTNLEIGQKLNLRRRSRIMRDLH